MDGTENATMTTITSLQNPRIKNTIKLRDRRHREKQRRILIDGLRELERAIDAGVSLVEAFVYLPACETPDAQRILAKLAQRGVEVVEVNAPVFEKLAFGQRVEGILGVAQTPRAALDEVKLPANPLIAVLEGVEKPGNVGAVSRTADGAGLSALVVAGPRTDLYNPNAIRASLGALFTLPVAAASVEDTLAWLRRQNLAILAARVDGSVPYTEVDYRRPTAIVLGSEAEGLTDAWSGPEIQAIRLPMLGVADSLNVSATAAVLFYEALRQRSDER
jgi:TrmH family RNA methyltransferase